jgi:hypothetical protein
MNKRTAERQGTQGTNGAGAELAEVLAPLVAGMTLHVGYAPLRFMSATLKRRWSMSGFPDKSSLVTINDGIITALWSADYEKRHQASHQ